MFEKGQFYPILKGRDGTFIDYAPSGLTLFIRYRYIENREVENIRDGRVSYALHSDGEVMYFLFKFGSEQWMDASFHKIFMMNKENLVQFTNDEEKETLTIVAGDGTTGECKVIRLITLERKFSDRIRELIAKQRSNISDEEVDEYISKTYMRYATAGMMADREEVFKSRL